MKVNNIYELTNPQKGIWLTEQYFQNTSINNICGTLIIKEDADLELLNEAINIVIKTNDSLRLRFKICKGKLMQYISTDEKYNFEILDIKSEKQIEKMAKKMLAKKIEIINSRVFDFKLFKLSSGFGGFIINIHHIISDAATLSLVCREIVDNYSKLKKNEEITQKKYSYLDYIQSEKEYLKSTRFEKDKEYWNEWLNPIPEIATVFLPSARKTINDYKSKRYEIILENKLVKDIKKYCDANKISMYNFLIGVYSIYFGKTNNMDIFTIGTPILNRTNSKEKNTCGMFINTSLIKIDLSKNISFKEFLQNVAKNSMSMLRHQKYNYQYILEDMRKKDKTIAELYDIGISYQITKTTDSSLETPYSTKWYGADYIANTLDVHFHDNDDTGSIYVAYDYQISKLCDKEIEKIHNRIIAIINQVLENENILIYDIETVTKTEKNEIVNKFNNTKAEFPTNKTIIELFNEQVTQNPKKQALIYKNETLTYEELDKKSNQFANFLTTTHNIKENSIISVCMSKNIQFIITILGILKTGSSYLPIHPDYPMSRISYITQNSQSKLIISEKKLDISNSIIFSEINLSDYSDERVIADYDSNSLAYVIYTSGSTGNPKGVMLKHSNLINFLYSFNSMFNKKFGTKDNCLSLTNISFDVSVCEIFTPLVFGSTLVLYEENTLTDINLLVDTIVNKNVTFMYIPPNILQTLYKTLYKQKNNVKLDKLLVGVESIKVSDLKASYEINNNIEIINGYGPTETTICCTFYKFDPKIDCNNEEIVPIGKSLINNNVLILDKHHKIQPINNQGELYVSGKNVSDGYLRNPELTSKSFVEINEQIYYKTGDLGYYDETGNIHFLGRNDYQIKIRGHRVELDEITNTLKKLDMVENAFSTITTINEHKYICSYVVLEKSFLKHTLNVSNEIKGILKKYLPYYIIPTYIININEIPINLNGKVDKNKLPAIDVTSHSAIMTLPSTENEIFLLNALLNILNLKAMSIEDDYFDLGADSLSSIRLIAEISDKLNINLKMSDLFEHSTIKTLAKFIDEQKSYNEKDTIHSCEKQEFYELSSAQTRIYYSSYILNNTSISYNLPGGILMDKVPNIKKLEKCFNILIKRHETLRTYFEIVEGRPVQKIIDNINFKIDVMKENDISRERVYIYFDEFIKPFDLAKPPILRVRLIVYNNETCLLLFDTHHIVSDGKSMQILINELCKLYNDEELEPINITYKDYTMWENNKLKIGELDKSKKYWLEQFQNDIPVLDLPYIRPRPAKKSFRGSKIYKTIDAKEINDFCKEFKITPYMLLLSVYYILLSKYSMQDSIVVGSPIIARDNRQVENIIGMFVNTLPLKMKIDAKETFYVFLQSVKSMCLNAYEHQTYPFNEIVRNLNITRDASRNPLFDVVFTYQNNGIPDINLNGIKSTYYIPDNKTAKFDLSLEIIPENEQLNLNFEYCTSLFTNSFINSLSNHYISILKNVIEKPETEICNIDMLSEKEKNKILIDFNKTEMDYPKEKSLVDLFEIQVKNNLKNIAVQSNNKKITYKELNEKSNKIALEILKNKDVQKGSIIGVYMNKSIELVIAIWGILKSGCTYMPMFIGYPEERLKYMIQNSNCPMLITNQEDCDFDIPSIKIKSFEKIENISYMEKVNINPDDIAYVIYTSGSTGKPKGVKITHKCLNNYIHSFNKLFKDISYKDRFLSSTNISFDVSIWELFLSILNGATLVLYKEDIVSDIVEYVKTIIGEKITTLYIAPNILEEVYELLKGQEVKINKLLVGVEPIKRYTLNKYFELNPNIKIINGYGPTETTICSTALEYQKETKLDKIVSIGKPIGNTKIYIVDKNMNIVPIGVPGELCITGDGVGKGYIENEKETNKNFVENKFSEDSMIYRTGDLAKWNHDGTITYVSRKDNQVKISGYRIELQEIDKTVIQYPAIFKSFSQVYKTKNKSYLVTYFTADKKIDRAELTGFLQNKLAFYMIPNMLIQLDVFPITVNGKIDTKKLPKPVVNSQTEYVAPSTELEKILCTIWQNLFETKKIGIEDNFFELGGDSLSAIKLQVEALNNNLNITYADIFEYQTIKLLAKKASNAISKEVKTFDDYDYSKINKLLERNDKKNIPLKIKLKPIGNVLITGVTGFLGSHIIDSYFSSNNIGVVYCVVRNKNSKNPEKRLKETLNFYFGNKYDDYFGDRIKVIVANISQDNFGLDDLEYEKLANSIDVVINSAALVKHYGEYNKFYSINVLGAKNLARFCAKYNKKLYHISTTSVSGLGLPENSEKQQKDITYFSEKDLYKNQNLNNTYLQTKFEAEKIILEEVAAKRLDATILRMGNISNRYIDGKFQINAQENAFVNRIKSILNLGVIQNGFKKHSTEFAPVDFCAKAIINIIQSEPKFTVFHIFNANLISFVDLIKFINELNIKLDFVTNQEFSDKVASYLRNPILKNEISGIVTELDKDKKFRIVSNILMENDFSISYLEKIGFKWPNIDKEYITKYIEYFKQIGIF